MICSRINGVTMISSERPNSVRGSIRLSHPGRLAGARRAAGARSYASPEAAGRSVLAAAAAARASIGLEDIAGTAHGLQVAREFRIALDLAPQSCHLHVDRAHVSAELRLLGQDLAGDGFTRAPRQHGHQRDLRSGEVDQFAAAEQLAALDVEPARTEAD